MSFAYPQVLGPDGPFPAIPRVVKSDEARAGSTLRRARKALVAIGGGDVRPQVLAAPASDLAGVTRLVAYAPGVHSAPFNNGDQFVQKTAEQEPARRETFAFCPGLDPLRVGWKVRRVADFERVIFSVYAAGVEQPVSFKEWSGEEQLAKLSQEPAGNPIRVMGSAPLDASADGVLEWTETGQQLLPDGVFTAEHSPYRIQLRVWLKDGVKAELYPSVAWTIVHVLVDHLELRWGGADKLQDMGDIDGVDAPYVAETRDAERALVEQLAAQPLTAAHEVALTCPLLEGAPEPGALKADSNADALELSWGDGPRIPLVVTAYLRRLDGVASTPGAATPEDDDLRTRSRPAFGRLSFLWDWDSGAPTRGAQWLPAGSSPVAREYLNLNLPNGDGISAPLGSENRPPKYLPAKHLQRRGVQRKRSALPALRGLDVLDGTTSGRPWSAISRGGVDDAAGTSTAVFQPWPCAGDRYIVRCYLTRPNDTPTGTPFLQVPDPGRSLAAAVADLPPAERPPVSEATGVFELYRKVPVRFHSVAGKPIHGDVLAAAKQLLRTQAGVIIDHPLNTRNDGAWQELALQEDAFGATLGTCRGRLESEDAVQRLGLIGPGRLGTRSLFDVRSHAQFMEHLHAELRRRGALTSFDGKEAPPDMAGLRTDRLGHYAQLSGMGANAKLALILGRRPLGEGRFRYTVLQLQGAALTEGEALMDIAGSAENLCTHAFERIAVMEGAPDGALGARQLKVRIECGGRSSEVLLEYQRKGLRRVVSRRLASAERARLDEAILAAGPNLDPLAQVIVTVHPPEARRQDDHTGDRVRALRDLVQARIDQSRLINVTELWTGLQGCTELERTAYDNKVEKHCKDLLNRLWKGQVYDVLPAFKGLSYLYLHDLGAASYSPLGGSIGSVQGPNDDAQVSLTMTRACGWSSTGGPTRSIQTFYGRMELLAHELTHAMFRLQHAKAMIFSTEPGPAWPDNQYAHGQWDSCVMNYDPEPTSSSFCGRCILELRGWEIAPGVRDDVPLPTVRALARATREQANDATIIGWWRVREAKLAFKDNDKDGAIAHLRAAAAAFEGRPGGLNAPDSGTVLRDLAWGLKKCGSADATRYWNLLAPRAQKLDRRVGADAIFDDPDSVVLAVEVLQGKTPLDGDGEVAQYVNLPVDAKFVGGPVGHLDRLGTTVKVRVRCAPGVHTIEVQLVGHVDNAVPGYAHDFYGDPAFIHGHRLVEATTDENGLVTLELELPRGIAGRYRVVARHKDPFKKLIGMVSRVISARRLLFLAKAVTTGSAQRNVIGDDGEFLRVLEAAYGPSGIDFHFLGATPQLPEEHSMVFCEATGNNLPTGADMNYEIGRISASASAHFGGKAPSALTRRAARFADYKPYLYQHVFVDGIAGIKVWDLKATATAEQILEIAPTADDLAGGHAAWGDTDLVPGVVDALVRWGPKGLVREDYQGTNDKPWFLLGMCGQDPLGPGDVELDGGTGGVLVDLGRFPNRAGRRVVVSIITVKSRGGVNVEPRPVQFGQGLVTTRIATEHEGKPAPQQYAAAIHEMAHALGMVHKFITAGREEDDKHGSWYSFDGSHCYAGLGDEHEEDVNHSYRAHDAVATCVMFEKIHRPDPKLTFCDHCAAALAATDLSGGLPVASRE